MWSERWREGYAWLDEVCAHLRARGADHQAGREFDGWDLRIAGGLFGHASLLMVVEEHGGGKQLVRFRLRPQVSPAAVALTVAALVTAWLAPLIAPLAGGFFALIALCTYRDLSAAVAHGRQAVRSCEARDARGKGA